MTTIYMDTNQEIERETQYLVKSAIESEISRLELAVELAQERLSPFESTYNITSKQFMAEMVAEDLHGKDDEYIRWAGEYQLMQRLLKKLQQLQEIDYRDTSLFRRN